MEQYDIDFINDMNDVISYIDIVLNREELSEDNFQKLNDIKKSILEAITRIQLLELIKNSKRLQEITDAINTNKSELKSDLKTLQDLCEKIATIGTTVDICTNFFQVCTKVASYIP